MGENEQVDDSFTFNGIQIHNTDAMSIYDSWPSPIVIISDGAYGLGHWQGDPKKAEGLGKWYEPHIKKWTEKSTPLTSLWFWNREIGWANVHPILEKYGWQYVSCHIWDKGIAHIAGNSNTSTLRQFPIVTEVCVLYVKKAEFVADGHSMGMQEWLRYEWDRSGIPLYKANEACDVKNAATRKYLTKDHLFYYPPPDAFSKMVAYANTQGTPSGKPYFSMDGMKPLTKEEWEKMRSKFTCELGITNVWKTPSLHSEERIWSKRGKALHPNQKPLELIEMIIRATSHENDIVWEPFGGLCTGAVASHQLGRRCFAAEIDHNVFKRAIDRIKHYEPKTEREGTIGLEAFFTVETPQEDSDSSS